MNWLKQNIFLLLAIVAIGLYLWLPMIRLEGPRIWVSNIRGYEVQLRVNDYLYNANATLAGVAVWFILLNITVVKPGRGRTALTGLAILFLAAAGVSVYYVWRTYIFYGDVILRKENILCLAAIGLLMASATTKTKAGEDV